MLYPNVETFIGCDSSYRAASIVLYGAPYDSTTSYRPGARFGPGSFYGSVSVGRCGPAGDRLFGTGPGVGVGHVGDPFS